MVKEAGETLKAVVDFFSKPKLVASVFLASAAWMIPTVRQFLPVHGTAAERAALVASIIFHLFGSVPRGQPFVMAVSSYKGLEELARATSEEGPERSESG